MRALVKQRMRKSSAASVQSETREALIQASGKGPGLAQGLEYRCRQTPAGRENKHSARLGATHRVRAHAACTSCNTTGSPPHTKVSSTQAAMRPAVHPRPQYTHSLALGIAHAPLTNQQPDLDTQRVRRTTKRCNCLTSPSHAASSLQAPGHHQLQWSRCSASCPAAPATARAPAHAAAAAVGTRCWRCAAAAG